MASNAVLSDYLQRAMASAEYDKLEGGSFAGRIPACPGVVAFSPTLRGFEEELRSTLEDWLLVGLKLGHRVPLLNGGGLMEES